jgi:hypothetical protein
MLLKSAIEKARNNKRARSALMSESAPGKKIKTKSPSLGEVCF